MKVLQSQVSQRTEQKHLCMSSGLHSVEAGAAVLLTPYTLCPTVDLLPKTISYTVYNADLFT